MLMPVDANLSGVFLKLHWLYVYVYAYSFSDTNLKPAYK